MKLSALVTTKEQYREVLKSEVSRIYLESDCVDFDSYSRIVGEIHDAGKEAFLVLPEIFREWALKAFNTHAETLKNASFDGFLIRSLEEYDFLQKQEISGKFAADFGLYAFNSKAREVYLGKGFDTVTVPLELNAREIKDVGFHGDELVVYGHAPMMITQNCLHRTTEGCDKQGRRLTLIDRMNNKMTVLNKCAFCLNVIYNAIPTSLLSVKREIDTIPVSTLRLSFTVEDAEETKTVLKDFTDVFLHGNEAKKRENMTTYGHFKRGVE